MPYTHFKFLAYHVPTAAKHEGMGDDDPAGAGYPCGTAPSPIPTIKVPKPKAGMRDDAYVRLLRFANAVDIAHAQVAKRGDDTVGTLKIFMAPEFYFRPPEYDASFDHHTYPHNYFKYIVESLNEMFTEARFKDWLIIAGTVLWNTQHSKEDKPLFFNTMIRIEGGKVNALDVLEKRNPSQLDGMPIVGPPSKDAKYNLFHQRWKNLKRNIFQVGGVDIGAEICLDHVNTPTNRALRRLLNDWKNKSGGAQPPKLKLHLLPCGGMGINPDTTATIAGGFILRNDGLARKDEGIKSEYREVLKYKNWVFFSSNEPWGSAEWGRTVFSDPSPRELFSFQQATMQVPPLPPAPNGKPYYTFTQGLAVYKTIKLP